MTAFRYSTPQWWVAILLIGLVLYGPGKLEGKYFPAASPMTLSAYTTAKDGMHTAFYGASARLRPRCSFEDMKWYLGKRNDRFVPVEVNLGPPKVRDDGAFTFGPWEVDIVPPERLKDYSFADVYHHCVYFGIQSPWLTQTRFWN